MTTVAPALPSAPWFRAFRNLPREHGFEPLRVEGALPAGLRGTLYRNGPADFDLQGRRYTHWFDGDGAVSAVRFGSTGVEGAVRMVDTPERRAEQAAGRRLHGSYGTPAAALRNRLGARVKNAANTSVMVWQGRLFALYEPSLPLELSPEDLRTLGETDLGGVLVQSLSAHPHRVGARKASYNFGVQFGRVTQLHLYALPDTGGAQRLGSVPLPGPTMVHDFITTERHMVFFLSPLRLRVFRMLLGMGAFSDNLEWRPQLGATILVVPIDAPARAVRIEAEPFFSWHFANAHEEAGRIVVDYVRYPDFSTNRWLAEVAHGSARTEAQGRLHRAFIDPEARRFETEERWAVSCEFPRVSPRVSSRKHRYVYLGAHVGPASLHGMFDAVARVDPETGRSSVVRLGARQYPSEPVFVPRADARAEDDGYLLTLVYDADSDTSHVAVLDARDLEAGPLARAHFDHALPFTFHGGWAPATT